MQVNVSRLRRFIPLGRAALILLVSTGCAAQFVSPPPSGFAPANAGENWPRHTLEAERVWFLNPPGGRRFDASGLLLLPEGEVWTIDDRDGGLYEIELDESGPSANLVRLPIFTEEQLAPFASEKKGRYDGEGIARDEEGRIYICEETNRWILRWDPKTDMVERLNIDWSPVAEYFHPTDRNASFEGVAVGEGRLYVANERQQGRIIVVDLDTLAVVDHFSVRPKGSTARDEHYSGLSWHDGALYVLLRRAQCVLKVDPASRQVLAEYSFRDMEHHREVAYATFLPVGLMEGLAVDDTWFWLVADNNGFPRLRNLRDNRPALFKSRRPDLP